MTLDSGLLFWSTLNLIRHEVETPGHVTSPTAISIGSTVSITPNPPLLDWATCCWLGDF